MKYKSFGKYLTLTLTTYILIAILLFVYLAFEGKTYLINSNSLLRFDAKLYLKISQNGYSGEWLCAFFPAFPFLWGILKCTALGISLINGAIFIISFSVLATSYKLDWKRFLYFITIPSLIFMFVPYSEALFYASGTLVIVGLHNGSKFPFFLGLIFGSLVRPTTFVFIPTIIGTYFFMEFNLKKSIFRSVVPVLVLVIGLGITICIHYHYTKIWLVFFDAQKLWKNYLHLPVLPFTSWGGDANVRFDGSVLVLAIVCIIYLASVLKRKQTQFVSNSDTFFAMFYIIGTVFLIVFYRDGNLYSLNRFIYATPFILVTVNHFFTNYDFRQKHVFYLFLGTELLWLLFASYNHIHNFLMFSLVSLYFIIMLYTKHPVKIYSTLSYIILISINLIGFIKLYYRFINGAWIG